MGKLIATLLAWISVQIGAVPPDPPQVRFVPQHALVELAYGVRAPEDPSVIALYHRESRTVYLSDTWSASDLRDRAALVHELVHHVQEATGMRYPCLAARERLAYDLQAQWLKENGVEDPYAFLEIDEFTIALRSACAEMER